MGRYLIDVVVDEGARDVRLVLDSLLLNGGTRSFEATFRSGTSGAPTPFWLTATNLLDDEAGALVAAVEVPMATTVGPVAVTMSAGCAVARRGARADELLRRADQNMYDRKRSRRDRR